MRDVNQMVLGIILLVQAAVVFLLAWTAHNKARAQVLARSDHQPLPLPVPRPLAQLSRRLGLAMFLWLGVVIVAVCSILQLDPEVPLVFLVAVVLPLAGWITYDVNTQLADERSAGEQLRAIVEEERRQLAESDDE